MFYEEIDDDIDYKDEVQIVADFADFERFVVVWDNKHFWEEEVCS